MPKFNLPDDQVRDIAAFLHDRVRQAAERAGYQIQNIVVGDPKAGEAYFTGAGGCTGCHSVDKDLAHVAAKYPQPVDLQQKIVMPRDRGRVPAAMAVTAKITQPSGQVLEGRLIRWDDFSITIEVNGANQTLQRDNDTTPKVELHDPLQGHIDLLARYSDNDIHNLTSYLLTLK
jgi:cytochrome c551/c552